MASTGGIRVRQTGVFKKTHGVYEQGFHRTQSHDVGSIVYSHDLEVKIPYLSHAVNDLYGENLAVNAAAGGTPEQIHDGTDSVLWTASAVQGASFTFDSTNRPAPGGGTKSIEIASPAVTDIAQFATGAPVALSGYSSISMDVNVDQRYQDGDVITLIGYDTTLGGTVGTSVDIKNYFSYAEFDIWQVISIPLSDMNLEASSVDAFRLVIDAKQSQSPTFYIDNLQLEESGGAIAFDMAGPPGETFHIEAIELTLTDALDISVASGTVPGLSHDKLLALTSLPVGILGSTTIHLETYNAFNISNVGDLFSEGFHIKSIICDGTNTSVTFRYELGGHHIPLPEANGSRFTFTVRDDLTGLISATARAHGYIVPESFQ